MSSCPFKPGDTLVFDENSLMDHISEQDRVKHYGQYGYGKQRKPLYTFICEHSPQYGHIVVVDISNRAVLTMLHENNFRLATDEEC